MVLSLSTKWIGRFLLMHPSNNRSYATTFTAHAISIAGYYGPDCSTLCVANTSYTCHTTTGARICNDGKLLLIFM